MKIKIYLSQTDYNGFGGYFSYLLPNDNCYIVTKNDPKEFFDIMNNFDSDFYDKILTMQVIPTSSLSSFGLFTVIYDSPKLTEECCLYLILKNFIDENQIVKDDI
mgnify:CR=1 FL=1